MLGKAVRDRGDREAARKLVVHNLRLVVAIAYQYRRAWANILDLFQEGSVGVMEAVKRWEPTLGPRFGTYAAYWIRAYVLRFLMTNSRLIHVGNTRAGRKLFFRLEKERQKLLAGGFEPTPKLLAAKLDVDEEDLAEVSRSSTRARCPSTRASRAGGGDEGGLPLAEKIASGDRSPEAEAEGAELASAVRRFMTSFQARLDGRARARRVARAPGGRRARAARRARRALRRLEAAHGPDRRPPQEALPRGDRPRARPRREDVWQCEPSRGSARLRRAPLDDERDLFVRGAAAVRRADPEARARRDLARGAHDLGRDGRELLPPRVPVRVALVALGEHAPHLQPQA